MGEAVSQLQPSLQAAALAVDRGADEPTVLAALLHDVGRFIPEAASLPKLIAPDGSAFGHRGPRTGRRAVPATARVPAGRVQGRRCARLGEAIPVRHGTAVLGVAQQTQQSDAGVAGRPSPFVYFSIAHG